MRVIDTKTFMNSFKVKPDKSMTLLLGAGASVSSNIPSGGQMVWDFKRSLYCAAKNKRTSLYSDLSKANVQKEIQSYFDGQQGYPELWSDQEYSFYFEKCYPFRRDREYYIQNKVRDIKPAIGYLCLGEMIINGKIDLISTTNFDDLVQAGIHATNPGFSIKTISSAVSSSVGFSLYDGFPNIIKLHGDYLFDKLKNTEAELQELELKIATIWKEAIKENGLIVVGYAGNDNSVMAVLEELISVGGVKKGVYWCKPKGSELSIRANTFMEKACESNEQSAVVEIEDFDELMHGMYLSINIKNSSIDEMWKNNDAKQDILYDAIGKHTETAITNAFSAIKFPRRCFVFNSSVESWKELRTIASEYCVAILYKGKVWALGSKEEILKTFKDKNISNFQEMDIPEYMMKLEHSDILGMFYDIVEKHMLRNGFGSCGKAKYYDKNRYSFKNDLYIYDAVKISISYIENNIIMNLLPTVHVLHKNGKELERFDYQAVVNREMSLLYNRQTDEKIESWVQKLSVEGKLIFGIKNVILEFNSTRIKYEGVGSIDKCYLDEEPQLVFNFDENSNATVNQLKGLVYYGPLETYPNRTIRLAVLSPREYAKDVWEHLNNLNKHHQTNLKQDKAFCLNIQGFKVFLDVE